jgi:hypothetical protein
MRRKRQSASQSTNASQTSKCVAIDNCRLAKRRICPNRHFFPNRRLCRNVYLHIAATPLQYSILALVIQGKSCTGSAVCDPVYNLYANNLTLQKQ